MNLFVLFGENFNLQKKLLISGSGSNRLLASPIIWWCLLGGWVSCLLAAFVFRKNLTVSCWVTWIAIFGCRFFLRRARIEYPWAAIKLDLLSIVIIIGVLSPLYLTLPYTIPWQVNTDELKIVMSERECLAAPDLFGLSWIGQPALVFLVLGRLAQVLGEVSLEHARSVNAVGGLLTVAISYLLFRLVSPVRLLCVIAAIWLGCNHTFLAISRMAMRDISAPLLEVCALSLLLIGLRKNCSFYTFLGGIASGLAFYVYYPARITIVLWVILLVILLLFFRSQFRFGMVLRLGFIALLSSFLAAWPLLLTSVINSKAQALAIEYQRKQTILTKEGLEEQKKWINADSPQQAVLVNAINGITLFTNNKSDLSGIHIHENYGFVDLMSGGLIWLGTFVVALKFRRDWAAVFMLSSLLTEWMFFTLVVNKTPSYPRQLVILPFAAYMVGQGLLWLADVIKARFRVRAPKWAPRLASLTIYGGITSLVIINLAIYGSYIRDGFIKSDQTGDLGTIGRYIEEKLKQDRSCSFILLTESATPFWPWGLPGWWQVWIRGFDPGFVNVEVLTPNELKATFPKSPPFDIIMREGFWHRENAWLLKRYPDALVRHLDPNPFYFFEVVTNHKIDIPSGLVQSDAEAKALSTIEELNQRALQEAENKNFQSAESDLNQSLAIRSKITGPWNIDLARQLETMAFFYRGRRMYEQALNYFHRAEKIRLHLMKPDEPLLAEFDEHMACTYIDLKDNKNAEKYLLMAISIAEKHKDEADVQLDLAKYLSRLALLYDREQKFKDAETVLLRAFEIRRSLLGNSSPITIESEKELFSIYLKSGELSKADALETKVYRENLFDRVLHGRI